MGAVMNGMAQHGGVLPVGGTFFVFSDYMRPAVRLAALTGTHVIYSWTHDSIGLGEDGPTHQPIEHLASLRAMPGPEPGAPGRRQRDGAGLAAGRRGGRAGRPGPDPPGHPGAGRDRRAGGRGRARGAPTSWSTADGPPADRAGRHGQRGAALRGAAATTLAAAGVRGPGGVVPVLGAVRAAARGLPGQRLPARRAGAEHRGRRRPSAGSRYADDSIGLDHFGASAPGRWPWRSSASRPTTWSSGRGPSWPRRLS